MISLESELKRLQEQIKNTKEPMTKSFLLMKKIDLLRILDAQKQAIKLTPKQIIEQLELDLKKEKEVKL